MKKLIYIIGIILTAALLTDSVKAIDYCSYTYDEVTIDVYNSLDGYAGTGFLAKRKLYVVTSIPKSDVNIEYVVEEMIADYFNYSKGFTCSNVYLNMNTVHKGGMTVKRYFFSTDSKDSSEVLQGIKKHNNNVCTYQSSDGQCSLRVVNTSSGEIKFDMSQYIQDASGGCKNNLTKEDFLDNGKFKCLNQAVTNTCEDNGVKQIVFSKSEGTCQGTAIKGDDSSTVTPPSVPTTPSTPSNTGDGDTAGCAILGSKTITLINKVYNYFIWIVPLLVVVFSIIDFVKVVGIGDEKLFKQAQTNLLKRIVIGIIFFLVPMLVKLLIHLTGITETFTDGDNIINTISCVFK